MTDREKLIELIDKADVPDPYECELCTKDDLECGRCQCAKIADYILADGWIRPPCKVGDAVYIIAGISQSMVECIVIGCWIFGDKISIITDCGSIHNGSIGKTVFLTKEDAEEKLKELGK